MIYALHSTPSTTTLTTSLTPLVFDTVQHALGADIQDTHAHLQIQRPRVPVQDSATGPVLETVTSDVPDLIYVTGRVATAHTAAGGATLHTRFRRGPASARLLATPGSPATRTDAEPALVWTIEGERGEIRLVAAGPGGASLQAHSSDDLELSVHDYATGEVRAVEWAWPAAHADLPVLARNVAALYEAYADGGAAASYPDFDYAVHRHEQLEGYWAQYDAKAKVPST